MELVSKLEMDREISLGEFSPIDKSESPTDNVAEHLDEINEKMANTLGMDLAGESKENKAFEEIEEFRDDDSACNEYTMDGELCKVHDNDDVLDSETLNKTRVRRIGVTEIDTDFSNMNHETDEDNRGNVNENVCENSTVENDGSDLNNGGENVQECDDENTPRLECCDDKLTMISEECEDTVFIDEDCFPTTNSSCSNCEFETEHLTDDTNEKEKQSENSLEKCRWKIAIDKMKNSPEFIASKGKIKALEKPFNCLNVDEIADALLCIGIKEVTINLIKAMGVDGARLSEVIDGDLSIRECLRGVNLVDQQKISMFIRGWRPNTE
jgi:hypothetical protein